MNARRILWTAAVLLLLILGALPVASCRAGQTGLLEGRLRPCPPSPNCVCSEPSTDEHAIAPLGFNCEPAVAFASLVQFLRQEPRTLLLAVDDGYVHAVRITRWLRFRDDLEFRLDPEESVIHVRSASRVGYSDLGANRERVESIRARWQPAALPE